MIQIIDFENRYANDFKDLNLIWLDQYDLAEAHDLEILDHPKEMVLDKGGFILLAKSGEKIVGTGGMSNEGNGEFELIKMTVAAEYRGKGISRMLIDACLQRARELGAKKIFLYSNSQLTTAIELYKKYGFVHVDASNSPLVTADVKMELRTDETATSS